MQVLADAAAIDAKAAAGGTITPLCGLPLAVKDTIDVEGYPTTAATPGLASTWTRQNFVFASNISLPKPLANVCLHTVSFAVTFCCN